MNKSEATERLELLLGADVFGLLSPTEIDFCLDETGTEPDGFDPVLAAAEACDLLGKRALMSGGVTEWTADGVRIKRTAPQWFAARDAFRADATGQDVGFAFLVVP